MCACLCVADVDELFVQVKLKLHGTLLGCDTCYVYY